MAIDIIETWANTGDISIIPDEVQPDGSVSFKQGWGNDYQLDPATVANAKKLSRSNFNYLFSLLTTNQQEQLLYGFNNHIVGKTYPLMARVRGADGLIYESIVETNATPPSADWIEFGATDEYALLNGDENETFKVANATEDNQAVNFSQVLGIGQTWQDVTSSRNKDVVFTNSEDKAIEVFIIVFIANSSARTTITVDGVIASSTVAPSPDAYEYSLYATIPPKSEYILQGVGALRYWAELR